MPRVLLSLAMVFLGSAACSSAGARQSSPASSSQATRQLRDAVIKQGPFAVGSGSYGVVLEYKVLPAKGSPAGARNRDSSTLAHLEILEGTRSVYQEDFHYEVAQGQLQQQLSASAAVLGGNGGAALVIRFLEYPDRGTESGGGLARESWQLFNVVSGHLRALGAPLALGNGSNIAVGGVVTAVMMKGGIAVMPMASTAEVLALRVWTGSFYAMVPVRFDWAHGQWGEGQACYRNTNGTLTESGCILKVEASPQRRSMDADFPFVQVFTAPDGDKTGAENVMITPNKPVEILEMQGIARWRTDGTQGLRVACSFNDVWLRTRIDGKEGWVHGQEAFDALGLPRMNPPAQ